MVDLVAIAANAARAAFGGGRWAAGGHRNIWHLALTDVETSSSAAELDRKADAVAQAVQAWVDVETVSWHRGLRRLVLVPRDEHARPVVDRVAQYAAEHGLVEHRGEHPGAASDVATAAGSLAITAVGVCAASAYALLRPGKGNHVAQALATLPRESPTVAAFIERSLGVTGANLVRGLAHNVGHTLGQDPSALGLEAAAQAGDLVRAVARAAAFDDAADLVGRPHRPSDAERAELFRSPAEEYADRSMAGGLLAAAAAALTSTGGDPADAVLAGSPRPARFGPRALLAGLTVVLAREGTLVLAPERLDALAAVDTLAVDASAIRTGRRRVLEAENAELWQDAAAALTDPEAAAVSLHPTPDDADRGVGLMVVRRDGREVGTVRVGWELDPHVEAVLGAARSAGLQIVAAADDLDEYRALIDRAVPADELDATVRELQADGSHVLTVARDDLVASGDLVVAIAGTGPVPWDADVLVRGGLRPLWRLLRAVGVARETTTRSTVLARAASTLAGLGFVGTGSIRLRVLPPLRFSPVNVASGIALMLGWSAAARVALGSAPPGQHDVAWHALPAEEVRARIAELPVPEEPGPALTDRLSGVPGVQMLDAIRRELNDPLTPVLAIGAAASAVLGSTVDAVLVGAAMVINASIGGIQQHRARNALDRLVTGEQPKARVQGDIVDAAELRIGDEIQLRDGDVVPADVRLLDCTDFEVDESALTGESLPVLKHADPTPSAALADRTCMAFAGTIAVAGRARGVVVAIGSHTAAARASELAARVPPTRGVQAQLSRLTSIAMPVTLLGGAAVTLLSRVRGHPMRKSLGDGVSVAVAAVPEGLPLVATIAQTAAARRLSRLGVLVRTPRALEALGRVDTVCFDKTGTLTENTLRLVRIIGPDGTELDTDSTAGHELLRTAARACPAVTGDSKPRHATDRAVLEAARGLPDDWTQERGQPFEARRGFAAAVGVADGARELVVKGAPEVVLPACSDAAGGESAARELARSGLRVLAVATRPDGEDPENLADLTLRGFVALADSPRAGAREIVAGLRAQHIVPVMLTGDHPHTAKAIAVQLGWPEDVEVVTGDELAAQDRTRRRELLARAHVVARVAPEQKLQVVEAIRDTGRVVAMVGDGANDAAAIRAANIGIGVAAKSSAAARNAADVVLRGDDLSSLNDALAEGRALWGSVADAVAILLGGNAGEVGFTLLATGVAGSSPFSTRQLLLVNLLTDMFPAMAIAMTPARRTDAAPGDTLLGEPLAHAVRTRGMLTGIGAATAWAAGTFTPGTQRRTSTMALCGLVGAQLVQTTFDRHDSPLVVGTVLASAAVLAAIVQTPVVSQFFGCTPLGPIAWTGVGAGLVAAAVAPRLGIPALS